MKKLINRFWPVGILLALWMLFCSPYILKGNVPFPSKYLVTFFAPWSASYGMPVKNNAMPDTISQIYPWKKLTIDTWRSGTIPLWNPYSFSGTPHAANYQSAVFSPFNLLFFILPFIDAWSVFILLQPVLAGLGTYLFLRLLDRSKSASVLGAVACMFCGFMTTWMAYGTLGYAALTLPWALWAVSISVKKRSLRSLLTLSFILTVSFLSGHFQISLYVFVAVVAYIVFVSFSNRIHGYGALLLLFAALGVLLASPQILLTLDAYAASTRSISFVKGEVIPWSYLITLFSPDFYGNPVTRNDWFGHYAEWASYVGIVPLVLAVFAVLRKFKGYIRFFTALACFSLLLAYPTPLNDLLYALKLPAISTSAASRIIILFSFSLACLSAFGLDELVLSWKGNNRKFIFLFIAGWAVFLAASWIVVLGVKPFPPDMLVIAKRNLILPTVLTSAALFLICVGCIRKYKLYVLSVLLLLAISMFDSYRYVTKWMPFDPKEYVYPLVKSLTFLQSRAGYDRVFGNIGNEAGGMFSLPLIEGYDAVYQGRYGEFINAASKGTVAPGDRSVVNFDKHGVNGIEVLQLLGVRYIYHRLSDGRNVWAFPYWIYQEQGSMNQIYNDADYWVFEYTKAFPRTFLASSYVVKTDNQQIIDTLFAKDFDRRETLVLEEKPALEPQVGPGVAEIVLYSPGKIRIRTDSQVPKLLLLSDVFDPGWQATVDGRDTKIYRADYDFRAVAVPAGIHTVEYRYHPKGFRTGIIIAVVSAATGIIIGIGLLKRKKSV